jgi:RNA polymerase sigma-70 factor (ECF subfamily)
VNEDDLQKWLEQMVAGEQEAFEHIYEITCKDVYRTGAFFVSNSQDIDDHGWLPGSLQGDKS